ncbi:peptidase S41 [Polaribacter litorisediminis]|uniref:S41 family peptidase n=1 Tax=Polaribacter litorisediminis TaxID=1908341 RepID=UPI001CBE5274|nr:S41 family peptidase [Polaribacter litorisediminis]UAM99368.1 peptidase S41 [Polaribacter litorisediminis]
MKKITVIIIATILFISCNKKESIQIEPTVDDSIHYFIWKGLNLYYLWQKEVPDLADNRFDNFDDLYTNFRGFSSPEDVFESLLKKPEDRFSWIVDDYIALENSFQGINVSNGMEFGLVQYRDGSDNLFGYVRYVVPNSDAANQRIKRGAIFNQIDGSQLTLNNYQSLLFGSNTSYTVGFADFNDGNPTFNSTSVSLIKTEIQENPIAISKVISDGNKKIGYLLYNQFARNYDTQLNAVFANFKAENIDELIIDLRYNPGGSTSTAIYLGSMVTGQFTGQLYSQEVWNDKVRAALPADRFVNNFTNQIRTTDATGSVILEESIYSLELNKIYFITSIGSASASELVINALSSYIDVRLIGQKTRGKQVGSITLYDSDNLQRTGNNLSTNHLYAMQPLVFEISNKDNVNYPEGIIPGSANFPGFELGEDYGNLGVLGERSDPLLNATLEYINTGAKIKFSKKNAPDYKEVYNSKFATPASDRMFVDFK